MPSIVSCPGCAAEVVVSESPTGANVECPSCRRAITLPKPSAPADPSPARTTPILQGGAGGRSWVPLVTLSFIILAVVLAGGLLVISFTRKTAPAPAQSEVKKVVLNPLTNRRRIAKMFQEQAKLKEEEELKEKEQEEVRTRHRAEEAAHDRAAAERRRQLGLPVQLNSAIRDLQDQIASDLGKLEAYRARIGALTRQQFTLKKVSAAEAERLGKDASPQMKEAYEFFRLPDVSRSKKLYDRTSELCREAGLKVDDIRAVLPKLPEELKGAGENRARLSKENPP